MSEQGSRVLSLRERLTRTPSAHTTVTSPLVKNRKLSYEEIVKSTENTKLEWWDKIIKSADRLDTTITRATTNKDSTSTLLKIATNFVEPSQIDLSEY